MAKYRIYKAVGGRRTELSSYNSKLDGIEGLKEILDKVGGDYKLTPDESLWRVNAHFSVYSPTKTTVYILTPKKL